MQQICTVVHIMFTVRELGPADALLYLRRLALSRDAEFPTGFSGAFTRESVRFLDSIFIPELMPELSPFRIIVRMIILMILFAFIFHISCYQRL